MLMPYEAPARHEARARWACRLLALLTIATAAGLHLLYFLKDCPWDLAPDEAHYWDWSRHLDWSYYSKGPLVAWLIRASCELFGTHMLAVRAPAILCGSLLLVSVYILVVKTYRSDRLALTVLLLSLTVPLTFAGSMLMTIDSPYTCCWGWALVLGHQAVFRRSAWAWPLLGLVIGVGILAKYNMVIWIPSLGLFLLTDRERCGLLLRPGFWVMSGLAALCCPPILIWNLQNDWVTLRHVNSLAGLRRQAATIHWLGPLNYLGGQMALLLGYWFLAWAAAMWVHRPWREENAKLRYLWWLSAPMFLLFLGFSFKTGGGEINWPITTYLSGMVLAAGWVGRQWNAASDGYRRTARASLMLTCVIGLSLTTLAHRPDWLATMADPFVGEPSAKHPFPLRRIDPTARLRGWKELAQEVDRQRDLLRKQGIEPILIADRWNIPGQLGFYCEGHPHVFCLGSAQGDRHIQYDLWHPNPLAEPEQYRGRTFLIIGGMTQETGNAFERVEPTEMHTYHENGRPVNAWPITIAHGFKGLAIRKSDRY